MTRMKRFFFVLQYNRTTRRFTRFRAQDVFQRCFISFVSETVFGNREKIRLGEMRFGRNPICGRDAQDHRFACVPTGPKFFGKLFAGSVVRTTVSN